MSTDVANWTAAERRIADLARTRRGRHRNLALASWRNLSSTRRRRLSHRR